MRLNRLNAPALLASALTLSAGVLLCAAPAVAQGVELEPVELKPMEIEIWSDPDFRRRFVESYIAETDLEPKPTTAQEIAVINKTLELMAAPQAKDKDGKPVLADETDAQKATRLEAALAYVLDERKKNSTYSVLIDFMIANLYLNKAANLPEPPALPEDATEAQAQAHADALEAYFAQRKALLLQSADYYTIATEAHPKYRRAWRNLGIVYYRLAEYKDARYAFGQVVQLGGGDPDTYGLIGVCYEFLGQHLPAESAYRMANLLQPEQVSWKMGLVRSFLQQKRYPEAGSLCASLLEDDPTNHQLWLFQANAYLGMQQLDKAAENYEILDGLGKSTVDTLGLLANIYTSKGLYDTAVGYYTRAIELAGDSEAEHNKLLPKLVLTARVLASRGEEARPATQALIEVIEQSYAKRMTPDDRKAMKLIQARIALAQGQDAEQANILEEVIQLDPLDGEALVLLGQYHAKTENWDRAIAMYEQAANLSDTAIQFKALIGHAQVLVKTAKVDQAKPLLRQALQIKDNASVREYLESLEARRN